MTKQKIAREMQLGSVGFQLLFSTPESLATDGLCEALQVSCTFLSAVAIDALQLEPYPW